MLPVSIKSLVKFGILLPGCSSLFEIRLPPNMELEQASLGLLLNPNKLL
jgi:hypothetical protein